MTQAAKTTDAFDVASLRQAVPAATSAPPRHARRSARSKSPARPLSTAVPSKPASKRKPVEVISLLSSSDDDSDDDDDPALSTAPAPWRSTADLVHDAAAFPNPFTLSRAQDAQLDAYLATISPRRGGEQVPPTAIINAVDQKYVIRRSDIEALVTDQWLNDEIIMAFLARTWQRVTDAANVHVFNTFFYPQFAAHGYDRVRTWLRAPASKYRLLVVPINFNNRHWALATIEFPGPVLSIYDSLPSSSSAETVLRTLAAYLKAEAHDPTKHAVPDEAGPVDPITVSAGDSLDHMALRQPRHGCTQSDGSSCGVFTVAFGVCKMLGLPVAPTTFAQRMQAVFRRRMAYELVGNVLLRFGAAAPTSVPRPPRRLQGSEPSAPAKALDVAPAAAKMPVGATRKAALKTATKRATKKEHVLNDTVEDPLAPPSEPLPPPLPPLTKEPVVVALSAAGTTTAATPPSTAASSIGAPPTPSPLVRSHRARAHRRKIESKR
ncbi:SUMO1 sentrin specific peptidase 1 [Allomyces arbusculus]|nr:SUMO1 sentrin specific peptidase 1 [Allomyces arbusculus]